MSPSIPESRQPPADRPVENSELRDVLVAYRYAATDAGARQHRQRIEELFASLQQERNMLWGQATHHGRTVESLSAEISRLRMERLTREEAEALVRYETDPPVSVENSELREALALLERLAISALSTSNANGVVLKAGTAISRVTDALSRIEELFASLQQENERLLTDSDNLTAAWATCNRQEAEISRLGEANAGLVGANRDRIAEFTAATELAGERGEEIISLTATISRLRGDAELLDWCDTLPGGISILGDRDHPQPMCMTPKAQGFSHTRELIRQARESREAKK